MREFLKSGIAGLLNPDKRILVHNYKDFKRTDWGKEQIDKYVERWGKLGFLEGLDGEIKERVAVAMEQLATYLIWEAVENESNAAFEVIGFPMVRRIINGSVNGQDSDLKDLDLFDFEKFIKYSKELDIKALEDKIEKEIAAFHKIDTEAEACLIACETIISRFNGDERSFDELVDNYIKKIKEKDERVSSDNTDA